MKIEELIVSNGPVYGWNPSIESMSGALGWEHSDNENVIYASPNWENDENLTPFAVCDVNGDYNDITNITLDGTLEEQYNDYKEVLIQIINTLK
jgi:hypothetical protein